MASASTTGSKINPQATVSNPKKPARRTLRHVFIGPPRDVRDPEIFHSLSLIAFLAWVGLGSDGLSSSCYGPEQAFLALGHHQYLAVFLAMLMALTVFIISASYSQTIDLFPTGGGGYLVATKLLGKYFGLVSGSALVVDYVLTIAISIASGADAIFSSMPITWLPYRFWVCLLVVLLMVLMNLRGVKESVLSLLPIFIAFIVMHVWLVGYAILSRAPELPSIVRDAVHEVHASSDGIGMLALAVIFLRAYSLGGGTYTGIEAVSNGLPILREPRAETGKRTMIYMALSLAFIAGGILLGYLLLNVEAETGKTLNAVMFGRLASNWKLFGLPIGPWIVTFALLTEGALLFVAAQTGFVDGPRVLATMASDRWLPRRFSNLSARLVTQDGVITIGLAAILLLIGTEAKVDVLVVLYAINVFVTFTLSQLGMTTHWWIERKNEKRWLRKLFINGVGTVFTATILVITLTLKFHDGGWITVLITGGLISLCFVVRRHYENVSKAIEQLEIDILPKLYAAEKLQPAKRDPDAPTAAILVSGYNGLGLATLIAVTQLFRGEFRNVVFIGVGEVDAGLLKGPEEVRELENRMIEDLNEYCQFANDLGLHAELSAGLAPDVVAELRRMCLGVAAEFPRVVFFAGKLIFSDEVEGFIGRFLHNHTSVEIQNWLQLYGYSLVILPIRVGAGSMAIPATSQAA
jgi:amino acid transporter